VFPSQLPFQSEKWLWNCFYL